MKREKLILLAMLLIGAILTTGFVSQCAPGSAYEPATEAKATMDAINRIATANARDSATALAKTPTATPTPPPTNTLISTSVVPPGMGCLFVTNSLSQQANITLGPPVGGSLTGDMNVFHGITSTEVTFWGVPLDMRPVSMTRTINIPPGNSIGVVTSPGSYPYDYTILTYSDHGTLTVLPGSKCTTFGITSTPPVVGTKFSEDQIRVAFYNYLNAAEVPSGFEESRDDIGLVLPGVWRPDWGNLGVSDVFQQSAFRSNLAPPLGSSNSKDYQSVLFISFEWILTNQITVTSQVIAASQPNAKDNITSVADVNLGDGKIPLGTLGGKPWGLEGVKGWTGTMTVEGAKQDFATGYADLNDGPSNVILNVALQGQPGSIKPQLLTDQLKAFGIGMAKELANPGQAPKIPVDFLKVSGAIQSVDPKLKCQDDGTMPPLVYFGDQATADRAAPARRRQPISLGYRPTRRTGFRSLILQISTSGTINKPTRRKQLFLTPSRNRCRAAKWDQSHRDRDLQERWWRLAWIPAEVSMSIIVLR